MSLTLRRVHVRNTQTHLFSLTWAPGIEEQYEVELDVPI